jgi:foldase protein PrsA
VRTLRGVAALALVVALLGAVGCAKKEATEDTKDVVATVNGEDITREQLEVYYTQFASQAGELTEEQANDYRVMLLDMLVEGVLVRQEAERLGADLSEAAIDASFDELMAGVDSAEYEAYLESLGLTMQDARDGMRDQLAYEFLMAYLSEQNPDLTISEAYSNLQHILVDDEALANDLYDRAGAGEDFAALAGEFSTDTYSAASGGELGWSPTSAYVPEFAAAADALAVGAISAPVKSEYGWHIIKKIAEVVAGTTLAEVPEDVRSSVTTDELNVAYTEYVASLRSDAEIAYTDTTLQP